MSEDSNTPIVANTGPVLCFGEIVWDALPSGIYLGGAPLNVAFHLQQLGTAALPVSAVGNDFLGDEVIRRLALKKVSTKWIQRRREPTGSVVAHIGAAGDARYDILENRAWDHIEASAALMAIAGGATALVYGSLAARSDSSRHTLQQLLAAAPLKLCDVNLRAPHDAPEAVLPLARQADWLKLNREELARLAPSGLLRADTADSAADLPAAQLATFADWVGVANIIVTCGGDGAIVWSGGQRYAQAAPRIKVSDTVGAGDAFTARFLHGVLRQEATQQCLKAAVELGAWVASQPGAQPDHSG